MSSTLALSVAAADPVVRLNRQGHAACLSLAGPYVIGTAAQIDSLLAALDFSGLRSVEIDCTGIDRVDTAGAWLIVRTERALAAAGTAVNLTGVDETYRPLLAMVTDRAADKPVPPKRRNGFIVLLDRIGHGLVQVLDRSVAIIGFLGAVVVEISGLFVQPRRLRVAALVTQMEETGLNAMPIVGMLSFLIGVVFAYQGADQLRRFGAEIYTVNLLGISVLREVGGLMAAIIVAGRSGSSFTAQIGTMKVNEELDAMETLGLSPIEVLVVPRIVGLLITLPLLTFFSNMLGIAGGALMCGIDLGISLPAFLAQLRTALVGWTFWIGLFKAPFFAFIIALIGCFEGMRVERNAASVGRLTTRSVVESIFLIIVADALFSVFFSFLKI